MGDALGRNRKQMRQEGHQGGKKCSGTDGGGKR